MLVRGKLIDPNFLYKQNLRLVIVVWERLESWVKGIRELFGYPEAYDAFEWLANLMKEMQEEELKGEPTKSFREIHEEARKQIEETRKKHQQKSYQYMK